jgi:hypothetical protein
LSENKGGRSGRKREREIENYLDVPDEQFGYAGCDR